MMKKTITAVAVLALGASLAFAGNHGEGKHGRGGKGGFEFSERFAQKLNLTEAQKQQLSAIQKNFRDQNKAFFDQARATRKQFHDAKEANDTAALEALKPTMEAQRAQMNQLRDAQRQQVLNILTPEQRTQFEAMKAEHGSRRGERKNQK
jgi:periplasmic protein CpxP/Spy